MRPLLLLVAMVAAGQYEVRYDNGCIYFHHTNGYDTPLVGGSSTGDVIEDRNCPSWRQWRHEYRIDWLRPAIPEAVIAIDDYGRPVLVVGSGFYEIIGSAPEGLLTIYLPNGKRVKITRAELEGRAK